MSDIAGVLQGNTLAPYLFRICLHYVLRTSMDLMKENGLKLENARIRRHLARTITDIDYADDLALLANTPAQAKFLRHSPERIAGGISLKVNAEKTGYMCFNQRSYISARNGGSLKLVDLGSNVSSTENDINTRLVKAWTATNRLSVIWKSDLSY